MTKITLYRILAHIVGLIGFSILIYKLGWLVGLAILLILFGNNLERLADLKDQLGL